MSETMVEPTPTALAARRPDVATTAPRRVARRAHDVDVRRPRVASIAGLLHHLHDGARIGHHGVLVSFELPREALHRHRAARRLDLAGHGRRGSIRVLDATSLLDTPVVGGVELAGLALRVAAATAGHTHVRVALHGAEALAQVHGRSGAALRAAIDDVRTTLQAQPNVVAVLG